MKKKLYIVILLSVMFFIGSVSVRADIHNYIYMNGEDALNPSGIDGTIMFKNCFPSFNEYEYFQYVFNYSTSNFSKGIFVSFDYEAIRDDGLDIEDMLITAQGKKNCWIEEEMDVDNVVNFIKFCSGNYDKPILFSDKCYTQIRRDRTETFDPTSGANKGGFLTHLISKNAAVVINGRGNNAENAKIVSPVYIIYEIELKDEDGKKQRIVGGEGFSETGIFTYVNHNVNDILYENPLDTVLSGIKEIVFGNGLRYDVDRDYLDYDIIYLARSLYYNNSNFFKVDSKFNATNPYLTGLCKSEEDCAEKYNYKVIASSIYRDNIDAAADEWYKNVGIDMTNMIKYINYLKGNQQVRSVSEDLIESVRDYGVEYVFDDDYSAKKYLEDLKKVYTLLLAVHREKTEGNFMVDGEDGSKEMDAVEAGKKYIFEKLIGTDDFKTLNNSKFSGISKETKYLRGAFMLDAQDAVTDKLKIEKNDDVYKYIIDKDQFKIDLEFFMQAAAYFNYMSQFTDLTNDEKQSLEELSDDLVELAAKYKISPDLFSCSNLIGKELQEKINSYFNIVRIAVPILLIGLGVMEYLKALFAQDDDSMKKAQKAFFVRIAISVLFFLTPTIVNLILKLANSIWLNINPDSCIQL